MPKPSNENKNKEHFETRIRFDLTTRTTWNYVVWNTTRTKTHKNTKTHTMLTQAISNTKWTAIAVRMQRSNIQVLNQISLSVCVSFMCEHKQQYFYNTLRFPMPYYYYQCGHFSLLAFEQPFQRRLCLCYFTAFSSQCSRFVHQRCRR